MISSLSFRGHGGLDSLGPRWCAQTDSQVPFTLPRLSVPSDIIHWLSIYSIRHCVRDMVLSANVMSHTVDLPIVTSLYLSSDKKLYRNDVTVISRLSVGIFEIVI